jgi:hypothetical protein
MSTDFPRLIKHDIRCIPNDALLFRRIFPIIAYAASLFKLDLWAQYHAFTSGDVCDPSTLSKSRCFSGSRLLFQTPISTPQSLDGKFDMGDLNTDFDLWCR